MRRFMLVWQLSLLWRATLCTVEEDMMGYDPIVDKFRLKTLSAVGFAASRLGNELYLDPTRLPSLSMRPRPHTPRWYWRLITSPRPIKMWLLLQSESSALYVDERGVLYTGHGVDPIGGGPTRVTTVELELLTTQGLLRTHTTIYRHLSDIDEAYTQERFVLE